jgi:hypothetical protein
VTPYTSLPRCLSLSHTQGIQPFLALLALTAILSDVLIIVVPGVPFSDAELYAVYEVSLWLSISILGLMMLVGGAGRWWLWTWERMDISGTNNGLERGALGAPDTILAVARRCVDLGLHLGGPGRLRRHDDMTGRRVKGEAEESQGRRILI